VDLRQLHTSEPRRPQTLHRLRYQPALTGSAAADPGEPMGDLGPGW
jgi:hypothetical protein